MWLFKLTLNKIDSVLLSHLSHFKCSVNPLWLPVLESSCHRGIAPTVASGDLLHLDHVATMWFGMVPIALTRKVSLLCDPSPALQLPLLGLVLAQLWDLLPSPAF